MKKIYVVLLISLLLGFVAGSKAKGQCEYCQYPYLCEPISYSIVCNGVTVPLTAWICYDCNNNNQAYYIQVLEIKYEAIYEPYYLQCEDAVWDSLWANIKRRTFELCGYVPCPQSVTVYRTIPLCGELIYEGPPGHEFVRKRFHPGDCNQRCVLQVKICYDFNTNIFREEVISSYLTLPDCPPEAQYYDIYKLTPPTRIGCALLLSNPNCP